MIFEMKIRTSVFLVYLNGFQSSNEKLPRSFEQIVTLALGLGRAEIYERSLGEMVIIYQVR